MTEQTEQLRVDLADARRVALSYLRMATKRKKELAYMKIKAHKLDAALTDACAVRDALAKERDNLEKSRQFFVKIAEGRGRNMAQVREELAELRKQASVRVQRCGYCGYQVSTGTNAGNFAVMAEHIKSCPKHPLAKTLAELAQARDELKDLQGANKALGQQVADVTENRDYWYETALAAEAERDQIRKEAQEQKDQLALAQADLKLNAKMLGRQLALAQADLKLNAKMLGRQCDMARVAETDAMKAKRQLAEAEAKLTRAHWLSPDEAAAVSGWTRWGKEEHGHVQERLATLGNAEAALGGCGLTGIYDEFGGLADAIQQMVKRLAQLEGEPVVVEIEGKEMVEALQAERQLRREAEQRAEGALATARKRATRMGEAERRANKAVNQLSRAGEREHQANQRAERAEANLARTQGEMSQAMREGLRVETERDYWIGKYANAEALAALVTPEMARLLEQMLTWDILLFADERNYARKLIAQIKEALDDNQA